MGRPTLYTDELADVMFSRIMSGESVNSICKDDDMPDKATFFRWLRTHQEFRDNYEVATSERSDALFEEMLDIADDGTNDWMEKHDKDGNCIGYVVNGEAIQRSRLRIDVRKFHASKLKPKKYGDKQEVDAGENLTEAFFRLADALPN